MKKPLAYLVSGLFFCNQLISQPWLEKIPNENANFYDIQKAFYQYWRGKDTTEKGIGYKPFKRWEYFVERRVYPSGDLSQLKSNWQNFKAFKDNSASPGRLNHGSQIASANWVAMGPLGSPSGYNNQGLAHKPGRDNFITFHPSIANTFWVGAPAGGLWKTSNNGVAWTTNTDILTVTGCSDLAVDPTNPNIMYLATGDIEQADTRSIGVLKSIDGGLTWNTTGLSFTILQNRRVSRIIINPNNPQIVLAGTSVGIYRTTNGGTNWTVVSGQNCFDMDFKPGDPNTVYSVGTAFSLSTNGGQTFTTISNGIATGAERMNVAVTPADPNYVYVVASSVTTSGLLGVFRSVNSGTTFTTMATSPNILATSCSSPGTAGQGWYDLAFAVSPLNKDEVVVGGVNIWRSTNGGSNFSLIGCWNSTGSLPPFVHADQHELEYNSTGTLYVCNDGGVYSYNGSGWADLNTGRNISQIYKLGLSSLSPNKWITGHQDNGTNIYTNGSYVATLGADGMDCFIDRTNDNNMFASWQNGSFRRSINGGTSWLGVSLTGAAWVCPWKQDPDPLFPTTLYAGTTQMNASNDLGITWTQLNATGGSGNIVEFAIAPSNNQVIYIIHGTSIRKTIDGGTTWTGLSGIPTSLGAPTFITVSPTDANKVWVTLSGYSANNKVFQSINGGANWTNVTYNLPNLPANCSVYQPGSSDLIYVGMDVGVYYRDINTNTWTLYNSALPNTPVHDMEISPANPTKLRAATYGRGVYEVDVFQVTSPPVSNFTFTGTICSGNYNTKVFKDASNNSPNAWSWNVQPNAGVVINSGSVQNPTISFPNPGIYTVSLVASNNIGTGNSYNNTVSVLASPDITFSIPSNTVCIDQEVTLSVSGGLNFTWTPGSINGNVNTFTASASQTYTVMAQDPNGCTDLDSVNIFVSKCDGIATIAKIINLFNVYPNPSNGKITLSNKTDKSLQAEIEIMDASGKVVMKQNALFRREKNDASLNISHLATGVYTLKIKTSDEKMQLIRLVKE